MLYCFRNVTVAACLCVYALVGTAAPSGADPTLVQTVVSAPPAPEVPPSKPEGASRFAENLPSRDAYAAYEAAAQRYYAAPFSRAAGYESAVYSRRLNQFTCAVVAPTGPGGTEETWLGTRLGIKRAQKDKGIVREYGLRDGLTGDVVEALVVDEQGAVALVRQTNNRRALCWWDKSADRWREIIRLPVHPQIYDRSLRRWRFVLTPTRVILAPPTWEPLALDTPNDPGGSKLSIWRRQDVQAGNLTPASLAWEEPSTGDARSPAVLPLLAAVGETVFVGGNNGLVALSEAVLATARPLTTARVKPAPPSGFISVTPERPRFLSGASISDLAVHEGTLWIVAGYPDFGPQLVKLTPKFQGTILQGVEQENSLFPRTPYLPLYSVSDDTSRFFAEADGAWFATTNGFLHGNGKTWERYNAKGVAIPVDSDAQPPDVYVRFGGPPDEAQIAPPASALPDAVIRAWVAWAPEIPRLGEYPVERRIAWARQRLPYYFSTPTQPPRDATATGPSLDTTPVLTGDADRFVRDPKQSGIVWHANGPDRDGKAVLRQLPAAQVEPWRLTENDSERTATVTARTTGAAKALTLPPVTTRLALNVRGFGIRPDGLYLGTLNGVLRLPSATLNGAGPDFSYGADWVPQPTEKGLKGVMPLGSRLLVQAGPEQIFVLNPDDPRKAVLRYDPAQQQFVPETALPAGAVVAGTPDGLFFRRSRDGSYSLEETPILVPVSSGTIAPPPITAKPEEDFLFGGQATPFAERATPVGYAGRWAWYRGRIGQPARPRYGQAPYGAYYGLAGYDLRERRWTQILELPYNTHFYPVSLHEEGGTPYAGFYAPDGCVWQYQAGQDAWQAVAPALPGDKDSATSERQAPYVWTARAGDVWLLTRAGVYHQGGAGKPWEHYPLPPLLVEGQRRYNDLPILAVFGNGLFAATNTVGLLRFDRLTHTWSQIAPFADRLTNTPVTLSVRSLVSDGNAVYVSGQTNITERTTGSGFLLRYDKKRGWQSLGPETLGDTHFRGEGRLWFDGYAVWYSGESATLRRDPATGKWATVIKGEGRQVVPIPGQRGGVLLCGPRVLERYDAATGQVRTLTKTGEYLPAPPVAPLVPADAYLWDLLPVPRGFLLSTSVGIYRLDAQMRRAERLPLPTLSGGKLRRAENGDVYAWEADTIIRLDSQTLGEGQPR